MVQNIYQECEVLVSKTLYSKVPTPSRSNSPFGGKSFYGTRLSIL